MARHIQERQSFARYCNLYKFLSPTCFSLGGSIEFCNPGVQGALEFPETCRPQWLDTSKKERPLRGIAIYKSVYHPTRFPPGGFIELCNPGAGVFLELPETCRPQWLDTSKRDSPLRGLAVYASFYCPTSFCPGGFIEFCNPGARVFLEFPETCRPQWLDTSTRESPLRGIAIYTSFYRPTSGLYKFFYRPTSFPLGDSLNYEIQGLVFFLGFPETCRPQWLDTSKRESPLRGIVIYTSVYRPTSFSLGDSLNSAILGLEFFWNSLRRVGHSG